MSEIVIVQLYPDELGVAGDRGNVLALAARLTRAGHTPSVVAIHVGDALPASADIVVVGGGPVSAMRRVHADVLAKSDALHSWVADGVVFFAYGSGAELLGHHVDSAEGDRIEGLGIFPFSARRVALRRVGYVVAEAGGQRIVGFEDNASIWTLDAEATPFARVTMSSALASTGSTTMTEGVRVGASIATLLGGPLLPLNPSITDEVLAAATRHRGIDFVHPAPDDLDRYAERARAVMVQNARHVFSRI